MIHNISHILYDLGNTLLYFDGDWEGVLLQAVEAAGKAGQRFGLSPERQADLARSLAAQLQAYYDRREVDLVEQQAAQIFVAALADKGISAADRVSLDAVMRAFYSVTQHHWIAVPGAERTLARLRAQGYRQAVLSNAAHDEDVQALVDKAALRPHLDFVLTSAALGRRKPDPQVFLRAAADWGVPSSSVLMVGDTLAADIRGAREAGMASVWVRKYAEEPEGDVRPDAVLETVVELPELLSIDRPL